MPKIQAVTDEMNAVAKRIGDNVSTMTSSQASARKCVSTILVHYSSDPKLLSALHLANVTRGYQNTEESLNRYQVFLAEAAEVYEWNDEQLAQWADQLQKKGVDIYNYNPPTVVPEGGWNTSSGWNSVEPSFPHSRPVLDSGYYNLDPNDNLHCLRHNGDYTGSIDCFYYARARAMEVNQLGADDYPWPEHHEVGGAEGMRSNSIAYFDEIPSNPHNMHAVYIEHYDADTQTVYYSEGNFTPPDGELKQSSLDDFLGRSRNRKRELTYYVYF